MLENNYDVDAVIIGGGIAGLFCLAKLIENGYSAILLEKDSLGSGQTIKSQGIIHGGTKYALLGKPTESQKQISAMPEYWRNCLAGVGDIDLSDVSLLANNQQMWAMNTMSSKITGFFASNLMKSKVHKISPTERPIALRHSDCQGNIYNIDEPVIDVKSLIESFVSKYGKYIVTKANILSINEGFILAEIPCKSMLVREIRINAVKTIVTAGQNNEALTSVKQQLRPLQMVYVKVPKSFGKLFVHILEASDKPRLTVSSYDYDDNNFIWYLGGNLAEKGANKNKEELIKIAKYELSHIFVWLKFDSLEFNSFIVNRAEPDSKGARPEIPVINAKKNVITAWPTKLAMAPMLANEVLSLMPNNFKAHKSSIIFNCEPPQVSDFYWNI